VINRIDVGRVQRQVDVALVGAYLQSTTDEPGDLPILVPLPETGLGPHLSYAFQWFIFATVGAVGWPLLLRKTAREEAAAEVPAA
jgi:cytochrome oxidase assembly protein ShyY1